MPRVHTRTKSGRPTKTPYTCRVCSQEITQGQRYFTWKKRFQGSSYMHVEHGFPRPSMLSNRKTAVVEDAIQDASKTIGEIAYVVAPEDELEPGGSFDLSGVVEEIRAALEPVADEAEAIGEEYESSADNMPESLQYGSQAEAMREVANELRDYADELRSFEPNSESADLPEREEDLDDEGWLAEAQDAVDQAIQDLVSEADDLMANLPEYQG